MPQRIQLPISGPSKQDRAIQCSSERTINMYLAPKRESKTELALYSNPGLTLKDTVGAGPHRTNGVNFAGKLYWVSGSALYSQDTNGVFTAEGTLASSNGRVSMVAGRNYICMVDGTYLYYFDGTTFTQSADADLPTSPDSITYLDGYFIIHDGGNDDFYINTTTEDPTAWDALDFDAADARPDKGRKAIAHGKDLFILGSDSVQIYYNSGNADFPFTSYPDTIDIGVDAGETAISTTRGLIWLSASDREGGKAIMLANGAQAQQISDPEFTRQINELSTTSDSYAWVRRQGEYIFYEINFPAANRCWSLNLDTMQPGEWKSYGVDGFKGAGFGFLDNSYYIADNTSGKLWQLSFTKYQEESSIFLRKRVTRVFHNQALPIIIRKLTLDCEAGVGTATVSDPQVMFRYSKDGGHTWSTEIKRSLGKSGEYETKPTWINLGRGKDWVFEFSVSDAVQFNVFNMFADIDIGRF